MTDPNVAAPATPTPPPANEPPATPPAPPANAPEFKIPDAYKDKPWATKIKTEDDVYKQIDNLTGLVGKKTVIPDFAKATPEERAEYYKQVRPKEATAYKFADDTPAGQKEVFAKMMYDKGLTEDQANDIIKGFNEYTAAEKTKMFDFEQFKKDAEKTMGADYAKKVVIASTTAKDALPTEIYDELTNMPNEYLAKAYKAIAHIANKYGAKETGAGGETPAGTTNDGRDIEAEKKEVRKQIKDLDRKPFSKPEDRKALTDKLYELTNKKR